jgi:hypothetical protein
MVEFTDIEQAPLEAAHNNASINFEWVRVRNWTPWTLDDGALNDSYNASATLMRYISVQEAPSNAEPVWGYTSARRSIQSCTDGSNRGPNSQYLVNWYAEDDQKGGDSYGATNLHLSHPANGADGSCANDERVYNSVFENFNVAIYAQPGPVGADACNMFDFDYNAYIDVWQPFRQRNSSSSSCPPLGPGAHSFEFFTVLENDHVPGAGSALIDTGHDGLVGSTPRFPVPEGGGRRIDIGAYEYGA